ncbi:hypothetical protein FPQ18DRAFT_386454 [Pyronema domesticum]|nr:hypothetical protein FPQ18DRAFT_386454 [Pyronema domesticum]
MSAPIEFATEPTGYSTGYQHPYQTYHQTYHQTAEPTAEPMYERMDDLSGRPSNIGRYIKFAMQAFPIIIHAMLLYYWVDNIHTLATMHYDTYEEGKAKGASTVVVVGVLVLLEWYAILDLGEYLDRLENLFLSDQMLENLLRNLLPAGIIQPTRTSTDPPKPVSTVPSTEDGYAPSAEDEAVC